ncbi:hypothetical protein GO988_23330 [Hymenobacter sp. HMF4947]|uniref:DUF3883 domain-containing protein n=1 Tax=Hymenobacter ginkgonis TaxID=2682976 RepID=A0A7K1TLP3_9BACT|nr:hypothetical protein [Hymenobacter ginkgonis]MVN79276.1 hypothetical protein [Hymenobacter ginkgonis]
MITQVWLNKSLLAKFLPVKPALSYMLSEPSFFQSADLLAFHQRVRTTQRYDSHNEHDQAFARHLKASIFTKTRYWTQQVASRLPPSRYQHVTREQWEQRHYFRLYSWGRFFLTDYVDKGFYITLGVDSGNTLRARNYAAQGIFPAEPALILKLDVHRTQPPFPAPHRAGGEELLFSLPLATQWRRIGADELHAYDWPRLITETVAFIAQHEEDLRRIWAAAGCPDPSKPSMALLGAGISEFILEGKTPVVSPPREVEANDGHKRLSNALQELLAAHGYSEVTRSNSITYPNSSKYSNEVDIKARDIEGNITFFEIKALSTLDGCIREALGQLLEYAYWATTGVPLASKLVIATAHPLSQAAHQYLSYLKHTVSLPIDYVQINLTNQQLTFAHL